MIVGLLLHAVGVIAPLPMVAFLGFLIARLLLKEAAWPNSPWRVPLEWGRPGHIVYSIQFGLALGVGIATAMPSPGVLVLAAWAIAVHPVPLAILPLVAFGVARGSSTGRTDYQRTKVWDRASYAIDSTGRRFSCLAAGGTRNDANGCTRGRKRRDRQCSSGAVT